MVVRKQPSMLAGLLDNTEMESGMREAMIRLMVMEGGVALAEVVEGVMVRTMDCRCSRRPEPT